MKLALFLLPSSVQWVLANQNCFPHFPDKKRKWNIQGQNTGLEKEFIKVFVFCVLCFVSFSFSFSFVWIWGLASTCPLLLYSSHSWWRSQERESPAVFLLIFWVLSTIAVAVILCGEACIVKHNVTSHIMWFLQLIK